METSLRDGKNFSVVIEFENFEEREYFRDNLMSALGLARHAREAGLETAVYYLGEEDD